MKNKRTKEKRKKKEIRKGEERVLKPRRGEERSCVFLQRADVPFIKINGYFFL
jgi:hypothetical protein